MHAYLPFNRRFIFLSLCCQFTRSHRQHTVIIRDWWNRTFIYRIQWQKKTRISSSSSYTYRKIDIHSILFIVFTAAHWMLDVACNWQFFLFVLFFLCLCLYMFWLFVCRFSNLRFVFAISICVTIKLHWINSVRFGCFNALDIMFCCVCFFHVLAQFRG